MVLSPAAQAVLDAAMTTPIVLGCYTATRSHQIAAALRAVADQVEPEGGTPAEVQQVLDKLLTIAAELEAQP